MSRRSVAVVLLAVLAGSLVAACAGVAETPPPAAFTPPPATSDEPTSASASEIPASPVAGLIVKVETSGLDQVRGFTLQADSGQELTFVLGTLDNATEFPPGHLKEHQAAADPVLVFFREENGQLVVYHIEDAG
jgi:hypothetical protein